MRDQVDFQFSRDAHRIEQEKEEKQSRLEKRRNRLSAMLEKEKLQFQVRLANLWKFRVRNRMKTCV